MWVRLKKENIGRAIT